MADIYMPTYWFARVQVVIKTSILMCCKLCDFEAAEQIESGFYFRKKSVTFGKNNFFNSVF